MSVRGNTGHTGGGMANRRLDIAELRARHEQLLTEPPTPERRVALKKSRGRIRAVEDYRSERNGA